MTNESITITIVPTGQLPASQQQELDALLDKVFAGQDEGLHWSPMDWNVMVREHGVLVSNVEILERTITVAGQPLRIGGIGGVATLPEYRRRGFASQAMCRAGAFMRDPLRLDFGLLVCGEERVHLYESLGWQVVADPMYFDQPDGKQKLNTAVMILSLNGKPWPSGVIDLCGLPW